MAQGIVTAKRQVSPAASLAGEFKQDGGETVRVGDLWQV
jgi:hypothetical protein